MQLYSIYESILSIFVYVILAMVVLLAVFVRDFGMFQSPVKLFLECVIIFLVPAIPLVVFSYTQKIDWSVVRKWTLVLGTKLVVLHILLSVSGLYTIWLEKEYSHPGAERPV